MSVDHTPVPFADLHAQYLGIQPAMDAAIAEVIRTSTWTGRASMPTNATVEMWPYMMGFAGWGLVPGLVVRFLSAGPPEPASISTEATSRHGPSQELKKNKKG